MATQRNSNATSKTRVWDIDFRIIFCQSNSRLSPDNVWQDSDEAVSGTVRAIMVPSLPAPGIWWQPHGEVVSVLLTQCTPEHCPNVFLWICKWYLKLADILMDSENRSVANLKVVRFGKRSRRRSRLSRVSCQPGLAIDLQLTCTPMVVFLLKIILPFRSGRSYCLTT